MKFTLKRASKIRQLFRILEIKIKILDFFIKNKTLPYSIRWKASLLKTKYKYAMGSKITWNCIISGRSKSFLTDFNLSRIAFRELVRNNDLPFFQKKSW